MVVIIQTVITLFQNATEIHTATARAYIAPVPISLQDAHLILRVQCHPVQVAPIGLPHGLVQLHTHMLLQDATVDIIVRPVVRVPVNLVSVVIHHIRSLQIVVNVVRHTLAPQMSAVPIQETIIGLQIVPVDGVGWQTQALVFQTAKFIQTPVVKVIPTLPEHILCQLVAHMFNNHRIAI